MQPGTEAFLARATAAMDAARRLAEAGVFEQAAGRAFYAMVYSAKALLNERGLRVRAHAAIDAALVREYVAPGGLDAGLYQGWHAALTWRKRTGDAPELLETDVDDLLQQAGGFVAAAQRLCLLSPAGNPQVC